MNDINWNRPARGLDKDLWGRYQRSLRRQPLCTARDPKNASGFCNKFAGYRLFVDTLHIAPLCERHAGWLAGDMYDEAWPRIKDEINADFQRRERER